MPLSKENISQLKKQLLEQIKHLPENKRKEAEIQIESLSDKSIEEMLESQKESQIKVFREIVSGKIPSKKLDENSQALAVLEIKPISKGHTIIIPKEKLSDIDKIPQEISLMIDKISKNLSEKLNPKNVKIIPEMKFGEVIINLIPVYDKELSIDSERIDSTDKDLDNIIEKLSKKEKVEEKIEIRKEEKKEEIKELKKFPRRIP